MEWTLARVAVSGSIHSHDQSMVHPFLLSLLVFAFLMFLLRREAIGLGFPMLTPRFVVICHSFIYRLVDMNMYRHILSCAMGQVFRGGKCLICIKTKVNCFLFPGWHELASYFVFARLL